MIYFSNLINVIVMHLCSLKLSGFRKMNGVVCLGCDYAQVLVSVISAIVSRFIITNLLW